MLSYALDNILSPETIWSTCYRACRAHCRGPEISIMLVYALIRARLYTGVQDITANIEFVTREFLRFYPDPTRTQTGTAATLSGAATTKPGSATSAATGAETATRPKAPTGSDVTSRPRTAGSAEGGRDGTRTNGSPPRR